MPRERSRGRLLCFLQCGQWARPHTPQVVPPPVGQGRPPVVVPPPPRACAPHMALPGVAGSPHQAVDVPAQIVCSAPLARQPAPTSSGSSAPAQQSATIIQCTSQMGLNGVGPNGPGSTSQAASLDTGFNGWPFWPPGVTPDLTGDPPPLPRTYHVPSPTVASSPTEIPERSPSHSSAKSERSVATTVVVVVQSPPTVPRHLAVEQDLSPSDHIPVPTEMPD